MLPEGFSGRLLVRFSPENIYDKEWYYDTGDVQVQSLNGENYWEASERVNSEFGFRFAIENMKSPHLMVFAYPDNKRRYMGVSDCMSYDLNMGISTGGVFPLSNEIKVQTLVFWPRTNLENVSFVTMAEGNPAAIAYVEIYELSELPSADIISPDGFRKIGFQFEDPCGYSNSLGATTFEQWRNRVIEYMKFTGQNELYYPVNWYHGPTWPSKTQPADQICLCLAENRRAYGILTKEPYDWVEELMAEFDSNSFEFSPSFTLARLGTLMEGRTYDVEDVYNGADTY